MTHANHTSKWTEEGLMKALGMEEDGAEVTVNVNIITSAATPMAHSEQFEKAMTEELKRQLDASADLINSIFGPHEEPAEDPDERDAREFAEAVLNEYAHFLKLEASDLRDFTEEDDPTATPGYSYKDARNNADRIIIMFDVLELGRSEREIAGPGAVQIFDEALDEFKAAFNDFLTEYGDEHREKGHTAGIVEIANNLEELVFDRADDRLQALEELDELRELEEDDERTAELDRLEQLARKYPQTDVQGLWQWNRP